MNCPKCGGEAYLVDEEFVQVVANVEPIKVVAKAIYQCRSCGEKFSRLVVENLDAKKAQALQSSQSRIQGVYSGSNFGRSSTDPASSAMGEPIDSLKFF